MLRFGAEQAIACTLQNRMDVFLWNEVGLSIANVFLNILYV